LFCIVRCEARDFPLLLCLHVADLRRERMEKLEYRYRYRYRYLTQMVEINVPWMTIPERPMRTRAVTEVR
jgi:hypothetical protein